MNFWERLQIGWAAFRGTAGLDLPASGRSSDETLGDAMTSYLSGIGTVSPVIDFEMLKVLKSLWLFNPDVSQFVSNTVHIGNPGHHLSIDAANDAVAERAINRLNESAARIFDNGCGVDGLISAYLTTIAWSGAISSEDVVNVAAGRVEKVVLVPVEQIRFKYDKDADIYRPYQRTTNPLTRNENRDQLGLIRLNGETYRYYALSTIENSPYAKPPGTAAVEAILESQKPIMQNIRSMAQKLGLMGLVAASVTPPMRRPNEDEVAYQRRAADYLRSVRKSLEGNFSGGLLATFKDQRIEHTPVTTGAAGVYDLNRMSEEQIFSGLASIPAFHGRTDSTTETYADVVFELLKAQVGNMQRVVKRRIERTYRLDLMLGGIDVNGVSLSFNKAHSRNAKAEAETAEIVLRTVLTKVRSGAISPDEAARELGYESWFDAELLIGEIGMPIKTGLSRRIGGVTKRLKLEYSRDSRRYVYQPEVIELGGLDRGGDAAAEHGLTVVPFQKKKAQRALPN